MRNFLMYLTIATAAFTACKSPVKQHEDDVYSRHMQRHVPLTIITTPMPTNKADMNLLLFIGGKTAVENMRVKMIMDSLWKKKLIQPLTIVAFEGTDKDYGLAEAQGPEAKEYKQFNDFVSDELYNFVKKKVVIRKFNSVAICAYGNAAVSSFDIAWNNDEKIQIAGIFDPVISDDILNIIDKSRKQPHIRLLITADQKNLSAGGLQAITANTKSIEESTISEKNHGANSTDNLTNFLLWAFKK